jgi:hypothetical protein
MSPIVLVSNRLNPREVVYIESNGLWLIMQRKELEKSPRKR